MSNSQTGNETIHDLVGFHETIGLLNQVVQGNLPDSQYVIALNAEWGSGKTFFLNQWATHLRGEMKDGTNRGIDPVFINAWENDLLNDPLPCILEAISTRFQKHAVTMKGLLDAGTFLMKRLSVAGLKALTLTLVDADKEIEKGIETAVEQSANKAIADVISTRVQLDEFKTQLGNLAAEVADETGFPLLIFLDELDRCRPDFALRMLETIKHLFNRQKTARSKYASYLWP
jgi:predicted KAP-like P-loop ATPase